MGPKKKGGKRQDDDWEAELGETIPGANGEPAEQTPDADADANKDDDGEMGGGLLAALKKNRSKKAKKGKLLDNDFVEGEDPTQADTNGDAVDLASKQPQEATFEDEDDVFAGKPKKGGKAAGKPAPKEEPKEDEEEGGRVKSKKEKEKEKKEREKQRKKEQVGRFNLLKLLGRFRTRITDF